MASKNLPVRNQDRSLSFSPWSSLRDEMMDFFDRFSRDLSPFSSMNLTEGTNFFTPRIEVKDKGNSFLVRAEIPGMSDKDINISVSGNELILEGEKKQESSGEEKGVYHSEFSYGSFYRAIPLTDDADLEKVNATYENGILKVTVAKRPEAERKSKKIPISTSSTKH
ncbi:MAG: Hsp20/alpha crystallin family protein [Bacteriovoracaceae bacterium]